ncbi:MAG: NADPH:quinone reductase [Sporichthyaceae bacterium]
MRAMVYRESGGSDVLRLEDRPTPEPGPGEVGVRVRVSGVNPTDWKARAGGGLSSATGADAGQVPNQDGAGVVEAVGPDVDYAWIGQRVWLWEAAWQRANGTAQEFVCLPARQAVPLPDHASFDVGASLGIPALTAHRCLTAHDGVPAQLTPGALAGRAVLVSGGAGAVGHAAIQLAKWAGATVLTTVSGPEKGVLAKAAGADLVIDYRREDVVAAVRGACPTGVEVIVEVAPNANAALGPQVVAPGATIAFYAQEGPDELHVPLRPHMTAGTRLQGVLVYTLTVAQKDAAVAAVTAAVAAGAMPVGEEHGLPLHRFALEQTAAAHDAVQGGAVGKVLIDL